MTEKLTAAEAGMLADKSDPTKAVDAILSRVRSEAEKGKRTPCVREYGFSDGTCYDSRDKWPEICRSIVQELQSLGYTADVQSGGAQFLDVWLRVSW